ncbi:methyl-accepting chemotaxis protein [Selenomonas sp. F0473]|uniref:methyl-accepting chemotaxis protein n=1 Tax=Selenomonas sp. F0473 TaxID=999423 RepID=UPI0025E23BFB|nr:methyl-accepting chemotaxis protein [Selenomonas sp. F0473]
MGIKQKLLLTGILMAALVVAICGIGYFKAQSALENSISGEIKATLTVESETLNGWLNEKGRIAQATANLLAEYAGRPEQFDQSMLSLGADDKDVLNIIHGAENSRYIRWTTGDATGRVNPHERPWYNEAKANGKQGFTKAYEDLNTKKILISAIAPYNDKNNTVAGVVCVDISLAPLAEHIKNLKYHGEGQAAIIDPSGIILASSEGQEMQRFDQNEVLKTRFPEMLQKKADYFTMEKDGEEQIIAYATVPVNGWIVAVSVPESVAFAELNSLKLTYAVMSLLGIILVGVIIFALLRFAAAITGATGRLMGHVSALAKGELNLPDLPVTSEDELGRLASNFNAMMKNIHGLIKQVAGTAEQLAEASEELTAGAHQMAESATNVASTVVEVADGTKQQLTNVSGAKAGVAAVSGDIRRMTDDAKRVAAGAAATADAAQKGETLMNEAMAKMTGIEQSVLHSAEVVEKLGESSKQIGEIVESISAIADQTNLLALNAAIEAARAGETGRGFAVVAEEVRKLAEESRTAAEQIKERITGVQKDTAEAVAAMQSGTAEVQEGTASIHEVGAQFQNIMHMVDEIKVEMAEINGAMRTVAKGTENLVASADDINEISQTTAEHMQSISSSSESQSASSQEIASASQSLATLATDLQNTTNKFKF